MKVASTIGLVEGKSGGEMSEEEIKRWELWYAETAKRDFERRIYEQCDAEDLERSQPPSPQEKTR